MYKLSPSILSADAARLYEYVAQIEAAGAHYVHIDIMDGVFVDNISFGIPIVESLRKTSNLTFDVHLMITRPERYAEAFIDAGADILGFHVEALRSPAEIRGLIDFIHGKGKKASLTVKPETPARELFPYLHLVDMALIMSVSPGFGGQSFMPEALGKAREVAGFAHKNNLPLDIEMDGGINLFNIRHVLDAGVNVVVTGSAVFGTPYIGSATRRFYDVFREYEKPPPVSAASLNDMLTSPRLKPGKS
ncbi:MAG: ribulose-phosphate 3-epimerase [Clostridiales bacterium]|jgi:ribulose-phosphate 3-epimerase|nr:ribulose-phosphate 3-epimerase [Clostridiales bacterium]